MEALKQRILKEGKGIGTDIVKVDMFLNQRIDTKLLFAMGEAWAEEFRAAKPDLILTVEASGIAMAVAAARALGDLPVVFAKKSGQAVHGMMQLCEQQKATVVGVGIAVEKGFQPGGERLREAGVHLKSLAIVDRIENGKIVLRPDDD